MWPVIAPELVPSANSSGVWPTPMRRSTVAPKPERSTMRCTRMDDTFALGPAAVTTKASKAKPGLRPPPMIVTPRSRASASSSSASGASTAHGNAASSAETMTFDPDSTARRMSGATAARKEVVATTTTSAPERSASSRRSLPCGPSTSKPARWERIRATLVPS